MSASALETFNMTPLETSSNLSNCFCNLLLCRLSPWPLLTTACAGQAWLLQWVRSWSAAYPTSTKQTGIKPWQAWPNARWSRVLPKLWLESTNSSCHPGPCEAEWFRFLSRTWRRWRHSEGKINWWDGKVPRSSPSILHVSLQSKAKCTFLYKDINVCAHRCLVTFQHVSRDLLKGHQISSQCFVASSGFKENLTINWSAPWKIITHHVY